MIPHSHHILRNAEAPFDGEIMLDYEARLMRRKRLTCEGGDFLVDLAEVTNLYDGDAFELSDGRRIKIKAGLEPVLVIHGNLPRLAWHIGNRHTPCRIEPDRLIIRADHVLEAMLHKLGAQVEKSMLPFSPEGGAYGYGRTLGHDHNHSHDYHHG